ncbi:hypothetical protein VNO77_44040 [Canavalia gladiata]|uniref:NB-ARC domain-containing protein n=1 Tax=Canavalia gladiata TaxID=3824 RepID=A0AAN9JV73_CANGL
MDRHRREFGMDVHREFRSERRWLILNRNFIDSRVEKAKERKEKVNDAVLEWLDEAGKLLDDISEEIEKSGDKYYSDMIVDIKEMNGNRKFNPFSTAIRSSGPIIIRRKKETSDQLLKALEDDELRFNSTTLKQLSKELQDGKRNVIGLHGKPGSGKTTLAKAVRDKVKSLKIFDEVLFVTVSQNPNIRKIQDQIAKSLNLRSGRATEIKSTLGRKNGILVILDDVPSKCDYDPVDIGIPGQRCKFLLTTSSEQDCSLIIGKRVTHCETMIPMGPLSEDDAWSLLQEYSGIDESDGSFNVAKEVASACDWLPGTIIDVSSSFKDKSSMEWTKLLHSVKHSTARTNQTQFILEVIDDVMEAKKYLYIQNMDMECEEIERLNADREFQPDSSQSIVDSKSQSQSSRSNPTPDEGIPDPLLIALKENRLSFNYETLKELSKELQNDSINQIALHGKRGSGKTRLRRKRENGEKLAKQGEREKSLGHHQQSFKFQVDPLSSLAHKFQEKPFVMGFSAPAMRKMDKPAARKPGHEDDSMAWQFETGKLKQKRKTRYLAVVRLKIMVFGCYASILWRFQCELRKVSSQPENLTQRDMAGAPQWEDNIHVPPLETLVLLYGLRLEFVRSGVIQCVDQIKVGVKHPVLQVDPSTFP